MTQVGPSTPNSLQHAVFATVGFGDIVAQTNDMRMLVTVQMLLNLAVLGLMIRLLTTAAQRGVARRGS
ncbi:MAG TPA: ion channel [Propionibacteriaceae bacterium]|jgi:voltage-gated potassium channel|nr:ion channel [Propionibacteriaceae bacterium]